MLIFKILRPDEWASLRAEGETRGAPIDIADGFVHFSTGTQLAETAARHFAGAEGLVLLAVQAAALGDDLRWEVSRGGALFPHLYRSLRLGDVLWSRPMPLVEGTHLLPPGLRGHVDPSRGQFDQFKALARDRPIQMLNLVRLRQMADYPDGHDSAGQGLSGAEAYRLYGAHTAPILRRVGGTILWRGAFEATLIGPADEHWDHVFIAQYPSAAAFLEMVTNPDYQRAVVHRQAAVDTSRLLRCGPGENGDGFG